jgi:hypothetical protein
MHQPVPDNLPVKLIKLKNGEDIVAYLLNETDTQITVKRPLAFSIENEPMYGRQMLNVREWIAPIVAATDTIPLDKDFIIYITDVKESFVEEFKEAVAYLYGVTPRKRSSKRDTVEASGKVVPFASMMKDPSGKPN